MTPWLSVIGIGEDGLAGLSPAALVVIERSQTLIGGARHLAMVPPERTNGCERLVWPSPMSGLLGRIPDMRGRRVTVLATGDPMHFGVGATLARSVPSDEMRVIPAPSAFSLAAARLGWPLDRCIQLTLHGRAPAALARYLAPGARLIILAEGAGTVAAVRDMLVERGFAESRMVALAHMGGPREARFEGIARDFHAETPDFHTLAVECAAAPDAVWYPRTGLPDDAFAHDGKLTKREARLSALARLMPHAGALLVDVGSGCGSVAIEWLRAEEHTEAVAIEPRADRRTMTAQNAAALGVPHLDIREGRAPEALAGLPPADAVFIGGGLSGATIDASVAALKPGGRLVANTVTLESEALLFAAHARLGGTLTRIAIAHAEPLGALTGWRPAMPVTQWAWRKG